MSGCIRAAFCFIETIEFDPVVSVAIDRSSATNVSWSLQFNILIKDEKEEEHAHTIWPVFFLRRSGILFCWPGNKNSEKIKPLAAYFPTHSFFFLSLSLFF